MEGLSIDTYVASSIYRSEINKYGEKCGSSLEVWESNVWINKQDPYGRFQWYCRYFLGRRINNDE